MGQQPIKPPDPAELQAFCLGRCEPQRAEEIEEFLAQGPDCSPILAGAQDDALVRCLRGAEGLRSVFRSLPDTAPLSDSLRPTHPPGSAEANGMLAAPCLPALPGYEILGELDRGGMGVVYKARQISLDRVVALKMILAGGHASPAILARFRTEAEAVARLQHPNVVQIFEVGEHNGLPFLTLEFCSGGSLEKHLAGRPLPAEDAARMLETLARAIHAAHQHNVVHRDLKPANVLLQKQSTTDDTDDTDQTRTRTSSSVSSVSSVVDFVPKITDFGLARKLDEAGQTSTGSIMGTPSYMAPEQASGKVRDIGPAVDVYALGAILYELLTGRPPFRAATALDTVLQVTTHEPVPVRELQPRAPRDLETICLKCLHKQPGQRYASAAALADDLERFLRGEPITARPTGRLERGWRWCRRHPAAATAYGLGLVLLLAAVAGTALFALTEARSAARLADAKDRTERALAESQQARKDAQRQAAASMLGRALIQCEEGDVNRGLLLMARGLEISRQAEAGDLEEAIRWNLGAWMREVHELQHVIQHPRAVHTVAVSADGKLAASGSQDGMVRFWDLVTGQQVGEPLVHPGPVYAIAFHPRENRLLTGCEDGRARLWEAPPALAGRAGPAEPALTVVHYPREKSPEPRFRHGVTCVAFSPNGNRFATGGGDRTVRIWDAASGQRTAPVMRHSEVVLCVTFTPDGQSVLYGAYFGRYAIRNASTGRPVGEAWRDSDRDSIVFSIAVSPDGRRVATGLNDIAWARQWDFGSGRALGPKLAHQAEVLAIAYSPDGRLLATASNDRSARLWDSAKGLPHGALLQHSGAVRTVAFTPDGRHVVTGSVDKTLRIWSLGRGALLRALLHYPETRVSCAAFSPDNRTVLTGCQIVGNRAILWDVASGANLKEYPHTNSMGWGENWVAAVAFSPDGSTIYTADNTRQVVHFWDVAAARRKGAAGPHGAKISRMALSPDGKKLVTCGTETNKADGLAARLWNAETGQPIGALMKHGGRILGLAFSPDGRTVLTGGVNHVTRLWNAETGEPLGEPLPRHRDAVRSVCFSPDGRTILTGEADGNARRWEAATGKPIGRPMQHQGAVNSLSYVAAGQLILTASADSTARLWHADTGLPVGPALHHSSHVDFALGSPDGRTAVTCGADSMARLWAIPTPLAGDPAAITRLLERMTGLEMDADDTFRLLAPVDWQKKKDSQANQPASNEDHP